MLFIFMMAVVAIPQAVAQSSMTDRQVTEFILRENEKGTPQQAIITKLIERGVSTDQLRRIRKKYEREKKAEGLGARDISGVESGKSRLRENNGEAKEHEGESLGFRRDNERVNPALMTPQQRKKWDERRQEEYAGEIDYFFPDTLALYDNLLGEGDKGIKVFGRNIFNRKDLSFEPEMNIATPEDYRLGPGDAVFVDVWGASQKNYVATVTPDGILELEGFGPVAVSGMTVKEANKHLRQTLGSRYDGSNVRLSVGQTKTISINVMGEVEVPGTYTLSAFATVFHALYMAGGTNDIGTLRDIKVYREGKLVSSVDVYDYILNGNLKGNVRLASGDVIIVGAYDCLVNITGRVKRPMYYEMKENESLGTLIKYAGGFSGDAFRENVRLVRKKGSMMSVYTVGEFEMNGFQLADGDSVSVDSVLNRYSNMVEIKGAVRRPGMYQVDGEVSTVRGLIERAGGLNEDAFPSRAVMHRRKADRTLEVKSLDLSALLEHTSPDMALRNEDVLFVPGREDLLNKQKLTISGEVLYPGEYVFAENTTLEDLILQAGGLTDAASLVKVDVSRRLRDRSATESSDSVAKAYSFSLKDGFVVDGAPGFILEPYDEVFVRKSPGYVEQEHVTVEGEVNFPGIYVITKKKYRLSDLLTAVGGFNKGAYPNGARLVRQLSAEERMKIQTLKKAALSGDSIDMKKMEISDTRFVGINLDKALEHIGNDEWDIVLQNGDRLIVPQFNNTVSVNGEVLYPNTIAYKEGAKLNHYINQAGGYSGRAKKSRVFVVNMNGTVALVKSSKDIQPGCEIVVPSKERRSRMSFAEILGLGSMSASLAIAIATLLK